ncbi:LamG-like jellyroll fold domain-containing protein [Paenibacillus sp. FSL K6-0276]
MSAMKIPENKWTHAAFTVNNGTVKVYLDGGEQFSGEGFSNVN